jgi:hypothetical protein
MSPGSVESLFHKVQALWEASSGVCSKDACTSLLEPSLIFHFWSLSTAFSCPNSRYLCTMQMSNWSACNVPSSTMEALHANPIGLNLESMLEISLCAQQLPPPNTSIDDQMLLLFQSRFWFCPTDQIVQKQIDSVLQIFSFFWVSLNLWISVFLNILSSIIALYLYL